MRIRQFCMEDYNTVIDLWLTCGLHLGKSDSRESIEKILRRDADLFLVVEEGSTIVGAVMGRYDGRRGWVNHLAVSPTHQSRGWGRRMLQELERRLQAKGCEKINLLVRLDNANVQSFYRKIGYQGDQLIFMEKWLQTV
ncbi:MAG TPA: GNAT family acetyltransferase [Ktedonobacteraceae bacterium]|nr:GNAT family acetyltransferase [Ktedonobacteraceae bacterium]